MDENDTKEVYYHKYCFKCAFRDKEESEDPCHNCLNQPWNINSHKPIEFKEK